MTIKHLFLDLEDTIITPVLNGWDNTDLINIPTIQKLNSLFNPDYISIFSFAIWNDKEKYGFDTYVRPMIEKALNKELTFVPTVDYDIIPVCAKSKNIHYSKIDFRDMSDFWNKDLSFQLWSQSKIASNNQHIQSIFLDDAVKDFYFKDLNTGFENYTLNIDNLVLNFDQVISNINNYDLNHNHTSNSKFKP